MCVSEAQHTLFFSVQASSQFGRLPLVLISRILQHVDQPERLSSCALVSRCWAVAAAAATVSVDLPWLYSKQDDDPKCLERFSGLQPWLEQYAKQLVSLRLRPHDYLAKLQLPCSDLQQLSRLDLQGIKLNILEETPQQSHSSDGPISSTSQPISPVLPKLVELQLVACRISPALLEQLSQLSGLSFLKLRGIYDSCGDGSLEDLNLYSRMLPHLSDLPHLELSCPSDYTPSAKMLSSSLTALHFQGGRLDYPCSLTQLVHLQKLDLTGVDFNPVLIRGMSQLLHLYLEYFTLLPPNEGNDGADSAAVLLEAVGGMRQLKRFSLVDDDNIWEASREVQANHFAALTASSHLTKLEVGCDEEQPLPVEALRHMFPAGQALPELQELTVCASEMSAGPGFITAAELRNVISACPVISSLDITCVLQPGADVHALLQLPATCRSLAIGGEAFGESAAVVVAQLTQLTRLSWMESHDLSDAGLDRLTALQALEKLLLREMQGLSDGLVPKDDGTMFEELILTTGDQVSNTRRLPGAIVLPGTAQQAAMSERQPSDATSCTACLSLDSLARCLSVEYQVQRMLSDACSLWSAF